MFNIDEDDEKLVDDFIRKSKEKKILSTSGGRFLARVWSFQMEYGPVGVFIHHFWWLVHNVVVHPMIGILPVKAFFNLHDWTSKKLNNK